MSHYMAKWLRVAVHIGSSNILTVFHKLLDSHADLIILSPIAAGIAENSEGLDGRCSFAGHSACCYWRNFGLGVSSKETACEKKTVRRVRAEYPLITINHNKTPSFRRKRSEVEKPAFTVSKQRMVLCRKHRRLITAFPLLRKIDHVGFPF